MRQNLRVMPALAAFAMLAMLWQASAAAPAPPGVVTPPNVVPVQSPIEAQPIKTPGLPSCGWIAEKDPALAPLVQVCDAALAMHTTLPNFICDQTTHRERHVRRQVGSDRGAPRFAVRTETDVVTAEVRYHGGIEEFAAIAINGRPADRDTLLQTTWTQGEFAPLVMIVLDRASQPELSFRRSEKLHGTPVNVFDYHIQRQNNRGWFWKIGPTGVYPEFRGSIFVDARTGKLRRLVQEATHIDGWLGLKRVELVTDYADVPIGDLGSYRLPVSSKSLNCWFGASECDQNTLEFHGCRKFAATSRIVTDVAR